MAITVNMHEAKSNLSQLVAQVEQGDEIYLARAGKTVAKLIAVEPPAHPQRFGALKGQIPEISDEEWEESDKAVRELFNL